MPAASISAATARAICDAITRALWRERLSPTEREDIAQLTWIRLLERLDELRDIASLKAFAVGIAKNLAREHRLTQGRRRRLERQFAADLGELGRAGGPMSQTTTLELTELAGCLERARRGLAARERWLVDARLLEEASYAELLPRFWQHFGRTVRTAEGLRSAFFQARSRLDAELARAFAAVPAPRS